MLAGRKVTVRRPYFPLNFTRSTTPLTTQSGLFFASCSRHLDAGSISQRASRSTKGTLCHRHLRRCRGQRPALVRKSADFAKSSTRSSQALEHLTIESSISSQTNRIVSKRCLPVTTCASANNMNIFNTSPGVLVINLIKIEDYRMLIFHSSSNSSKLSL